MLERLAENLLVWLVLVVKFECQSEELASLGDCQVAFSFGIKPIINLLNVLSTISNTLYRVEFYSSLVIVENDSEKDVKKEKDATDYENEEIDSVPRAVIVWKKHDIRKARIRQKHHKLEVRLIDAVELCCPSEAALEDEQAQCCEEE